MCHLQELYAKYKDKGLVVLGFNPSDDRKIALDMVQANGVMFPNIIDASDAATKIAFEDYRGSGVPLNHIIDREGNVVRAWYGGREGHAAAIATIEKLGGPLAEAIRQDWDVQAAQSAEEVTVAAKQLLEAIRDADYLRDWSANDQWNQFPAEGVRYQAASDQAGWVRWVCHRFGTDPVGEVRLGKITVGSEGAPTIHFELQLTNGEVLQGELPFERDSEEAPWYGKNGLDWHLPKKP